MKILGHTRAFSFRKVTLGAVTALIGLGTIGAMGNQAQASTHSSYSQSHRTTTNGKSTSTQSRVKTTTVKPKVTSTKVVKPVHQTSKVQTTKKVVPTKQSTKSIKPVVTKAPTKQATSSKTSVTVSKAPTTSTGKTTTTKSVTTRPKSTSAVKSTSTKPTAKTSTSRTSSTSKNQLLRLKQQSLLQLRNVRRHQHREVRVERQHLAQQHQVSRPLLIKAHLLAQVRLKSLQHLQQSHLLQNQLQRRQSQYRQLRNQLRQRLNLQLQQRSLQLQQQNQLRHRQNHQHQLSSLLQHSATTVPTTNQTDNNQEMIGTAPEGHIKDKYQSMTQLESETVEGVDWKKIQEIMVRKYLLLRHMEETLNKERQNNESFGEKGNYDYFSFEAIRPKNNTELHVTSTHYDDPTLNQMIQNRTATISIHGAAGTDQIIYLGGPPSTLRDEMETQLKSSGFTVMAPLDYIGGVKKNNFINREKNNTGVQLELTTALRKTFFNNGDTSTKNRSNESNWTPLMQTFVDALYTSINNIYPNH